MEPIKRDMELLSNSMATYAHIQANPESFALYFMMGVCFGLLMALCLLVTGIACGGRRRPPLKKKTSPPCSERTRLKSQSSLEDGGGEDDDDDDDDDDSMADDRTREVTDVEVDCGDALKVTGTGSDRGGGGGGSSSGGRSNGTLRSVNVFASAEELEKARRLEERERIVREIWRNGQPDILATGTGTIGRVHYH